jgi:hypothetical protein
MTTLERRSAGKKKRILRYVITKDRKNAKPE